MQEYREENPFHTTTPSLGDGEKRNKKEGGEQDRGGKEGIKQRIQKIADTSQKKKKGMNLG